MCELFFSNRKQNDRAAKNNANGTHTAFALIINVVLPTNRPLSVASAMKCVPKELQNAEKYPFFIVPDLRRKSRARHQWQAVPQKAAK